MKLIPNPEFIAAPYELEYRFLEVGFCKTILSPRFKTLPPPEAYTSPNSLTSWMAENSIPPHIWDLDKEEWE